MKEKGVLQLQVSTYLGSALSLIVKETGAFNLQHSNLRQVLLMTLCKLLVKARGQEPISAC